MKVKQFYNKNQFLIEDKGEKYLQSYESIVAKINHNGVLTLGKHWNYSKTTLKHLYLFLNDFVRYNINVLLIPFINEILTSNNKKKTIQKLIDNNIIKINCEL